MNKTTLEQQLRLSIILAQAKALLVNINKLRVETDRELQFRCQEAKVRRAQRGRARA